MNAVGRHWTFLSGVMSRRSRLGDAWILPDRCDPVWVVGRWFGGDLLEGVLHQTGCEYLLGKAVLRPPEGKHVPQ